MIKLIGPAGAGAEEVRGGGALLGADVRMAAAPEHYDERAVALGEALVHAARGVDDEAPRGHGAGLPIQRAPQVGALVAVGERRRVAAQPHLVPVWK